MVRKLRFDIMFLEILLSRDQALEVLLVRSILEVPSRIWTMCSFFVGEISFPLISGLMSSNSFRLATGGSRDQRSDVDSRLP